MLQPYTMSEPPLPAFTFLNIAATSGSSFSGFRDSWSRKPDWPFERTTKLWPKAMLLAAKVRSLCDGRYTPSIDDLREVAKPALRHRIILNFEGEAEGVRPDDVLDEILASVPPKKA